MSQVYQILRVTSEIMKQTNEFSDKRIALIWCGFLSLVLIWQASNIINAVASLVKAMQ